MKDLHWNLNTCRLITSTYTHLHFMQHRIFGYTAATLLQSCKLYTILWKHRDIENYREHRETL